MNNKGLLRWQMGNYEELASKLKRLPVPELHETLIALNDWLRPVVTTEELKEFQKKAITFSVSDGALLQKDLVKQAQLQTGSWLAPLWKESYLEHRGYLQSESNFALMIDDKYYAQIDTKVGRAAQLIYTMTAIYLSLVDETYPLDYAKGQQNLDMSYYMNFFRSCRIPGKERDSFYRNHQQTSDNYSVIYANGTYFRLAVTNDQGEIYSVAELHENLNHLLSLENSTSGEELISYFTGVKRAQSDSLYQQLKAENINAQNLQQIEDALFVLSFSDAEDDSKEKRITDMLLNSSHQFLAKTTQAIITKTGHIGFNMEHTAIDGVPTLNLLANTFNSFHDVIPKSTQKKSCGLVQKLEWVLPTTLISNLEEAKALVEIENNSYLIKHQIISTIGKARMKKANVSPDAFFHIGLALAQQQVFGRLRSVYEPVAMRMYYEGRTESARSISQEKKQFVEAFYNERKPISEEALRRLFFEAATAHSERIRQCQEGKGIERHLFGLQKMALNPEEGTTFFSDTALSKLTEDFISTTGIPYDIIESFSFGPVNKTGFGLYYGILEDEIVLTLSTKKEYEQQANQLLKAISKGLQALTSLLTI